MCLESLKQKPKPANFGEGTGQADRNDDEKQSACVLAL